MSDEHRAALRAFVDQPSVGFAPWILLSVLDGAHRVVLASALACTLAVVICAAGAISDSSPKLLDLTAIVFFAALTVVAAVSGHSAREWLGVWSAELSNAAIAVIAGLSIALRAPFTLQYAREMTDSEHWDTALFLRINYVITAVWAVVFLLIAIVGYIGDGPLNQPENIWTNWIIQIALVILAIRFTRSYPDHATANAEAELPADTPPDRARHARELLRPLAAYLIPVGILVMIFAGSGWWIGAGLLVLGIITSRALRRAATGAKLRERTRT
jgi:multisubunit Na+/H+ antiporter MnhB subunit